MVIESPFYRHKNILKYPCSLMRGRLGQFITPIYPLKHRLHIQLFLLMNNSHDMCCCCCFLAISAKCHNISLLLHIIFLLIINNLFRNKLWNILLKVIRSKTSCTNHQLHINLKTVITFNVFPVAMVSYNFTHHKY